MNHLWRIRGTDHDLSQRGMIMGIVNVTPDSFSDGGKFLDAGRAVEHALRLVEEGADILDIGGESTRPGADPVEEAEELRRVLPVIRTLRSVTKTLISIDTMKGAVARAALDAGADIINDVTGLRGDPAMSHVASECDAGLVVMHMTGTPRTMQQKPEYVDVVADVSAHFAERLHTLESTGIDPKRIALDPGFGFGKTLEHNISLVRALPRLAEIGRPLLVGVSRKSMIARLLEEDGLETREWPTVALTSHMRELGARVFRVHEVKPNVHALRMTEAIATHA
ncbi:dihydropteroate synthase [Brevifollis gellanilyticus]|uniref:Dihydropteroate synthase n=1 Tax=Brevifollis gellanilyticus TaxID=748831 RepID=A0A512M4H2_9BACT|nr:dihydropteroate synthase [Brevifollis gellanilyticus]GEP41636.1 dihydropteroate synthase [Brevifollis gellanilyticus]